MENNKNTNSLSYIISNNLKAVAIIVTFIVALYANNQLHDVQIGDIQKQILLLEAKQEESYKKIDEIKLDKAVFQATMNQLTPIQEELKEVRTDIKEILKSLNNR